MLSLKTEKRDPKVKNYTLRRGGFIPAVYYGKKEEATSITVSQKEFSQTWEKAGESTVIQLKDGDGTHDVLIYDVFVDPVTDEPLHADFYVFEKGHRMEMGIPLEFEGEAPVEKTGGIVVKVLHELEIEAAPKDLPHDIKVDLSVLTDLDSQIVASDLPLPEGVELRENPEEVVVSVSEAKEEEEEEEEEADIGEIEVEEKGKEKEEGEEEGEE